MTISLSECDVITRELETTLTGGGIQKIHQPQPHTVTFDIRMPGKSLVLLISVEPQFARIHLTSKKLENPPTPPPFCQFLRAQVEGGRIERIRQEFDDRIVYVTIRTSTACFVLVVALTGRQANVLLLNEQRGFLKSLKPARLKVGDLYKPPTQQKHQSHPSPKPPTFAEAKPRLRAGRSPLMEEGGESKGEEFDKRFPVSAMLEERYSKSEAEIQTVQLARARIGQVQKALKKEQRRARALEQDLEKTERYREYYRYGELLKGSLHQLKRGQDQIAVTDYYDPALPELVIPLDSSRDPAWNMEDYFRKHRKYLSAQEHLRPRLESALNDVERLKKELDRLKKSEFEELVGGLSNTVLKDKQVPTPLTLALSLTEVEGKKRTESQNKRTKGRAKPYREFESFDGIPIWVGKNAKENDTLTLKVAKPDDLWLHARGTPGSHVVVRLEKGVQVPHETLRDAATLALWYSDLKKSGKGEVIYTLRKFVKKGKGLKPGVVMVDREKSLWIELKADRLERLKGRIG